MKLVQVETFCTEEGAFVVIFVRQFAGFFLYILRQVIKDDSTWPLYGSQLMSPSVHPPQ